MKLATASHQQLHHHWWGAMASGFCSAIFMVASVPKTFHTKSHIQKYSAADYYHKPNFAAVVK
jgi:hypothetical protein